VLFDQMYLAFAPIRVMRAGALHQISENGCGWMLVWRPVTSRWMALRVRLRGAILLPLAGLSMLLLRFLSER